MFYERRLSKISNETDLIIIPSQIIKKDSIIVLFTIFSRYIWCSWCYGKMVSRPWKKSESAKCLINHRHILANFSVNRQGYWRKIQENMCFWDEKKVNFNSFFPSALQKLEIWAQRKCSSEMLQILQWENPCTVVFHFIQLYFFPYEFWEIFFLKPDSLVPLHEVIFDNFVRWRNQAKLIYITFQKYYTTMYLKM